MRLKRVKVTGLTSATLERPKLARATRGLYNRNFAAHLCSWLTRCPLKAEITGSSPVCAANKSVSRRQERHGKIRSRAESNDSLGSRVFWSLFRLLMPDTRTILVQSL